MDVCDGSIELKPGERTGDEKKGEEGWEDSEKGTNTQTDHKLFRWS